AQDMAEVDTPNAGTIEEVSDLLGVPPERCLKTLLVEGSDGQPVALVLRGDHQLNAVKAEKTPGIAAPLTFVSTETIRQVAGADRDGKHLVGVNWGRDLPEPEVADLRNVVDGDPSPDGKGRLRIRRVIEVGHIFQLGRTYSEAMDCTVLDANGKALVPLMG